MQILPGKKGCKLGEKCLFMSSAGFRVNACFTTMACARESMLQVMKVTDHSRQNYGVLRNSLEAHIFTKLRDWMTSEKKCRRNCMPQKLHAADLRQETEIL